MKRLILLALLGLSLFSCKEETEPIPKPKKDVGMHYFYIQNNLPQNVNFTFSTIVFENSYLDSGYEINKHYKVVAFRGQKTLVRVCSYQDRPIEPLNCFYYESLPVYEAFVKKELCRIKHPETNQRAYDNIWTGKFWEYKQTSKWEAEYTLIVDEELLNKLDFTKLPEEPETIP